MEPSDARHHLRDEKYRLEAVRGELAESGPGGRGRDPQPLEVSAADQHQADLGTDTFNRERDLSILDSVEAELADVERALARLDEGTYGTCEVCGSAIGDERLEVLPAARYCVVHQRQLEDEPRPGEEGWNAGGGVNA